MKNKREELRQLRLKMLDFSEEAEEKSDIELECRKKIEELRTIFAIADPGNLQRKVYLFRGLVSAPFNRLRLKRRFQTTSSTVYLSPLCTTL